MFQKIEEKVGKVNKYVTSGNYYQEVFVILWIAKSVFYDTWLHQHSVVNHN